MHRVRHADQPGVHACQLVNMHDRLDPRHMHNRMDALYVSRALHVAILRDVFVHRPGLVGVGWRDRAAARATMTATMMRACIRCRADKYPGREQRSRQRGYPLQHVAFLCLTMPQLMLADCIGGTQPAVFKRFPGSLTSIKSSIS